MQQRLKQQQRRLRRVIVVKDYQGNPYLKVLLSGRELFLQETLVQFKLMLKLKKILSFSEHLVTPLFKKKRMHKHAVLKLAF